MEDIEIYKKAKARVENKTHNRYVTDADIIIEQEKEIQYYRNKIKVISERNTFTCSCDCAQGKDYTVINYYADGKLIKTEYRY